VLNLDDLSEDLVPPSLESLKLRQDRFGFAHLPILPHREVGHQKNLRKFNQVRCNVTELKLWYDAGERKIEEAVPGGTARRLHKKVTRLSAYGVTSAARLPSPNITRGGRMTSTKRSAPSGTTAALVVDDEAEDEVSNQGAPGPEIRQGVAAPEGQLLISFDEVVRLLRLRPVTNDAAELQRIALAAALVAEGMALLIVSTIPHRGRAVALPAPRPHVADRFFAAGIRFNVHAGSAIWLDGSRRPKDLRLPIAEVVRFLWARPSHRATRVEIHAHLVSGRLYGGTVENLRKIVDRFRKEFGLRAGDVLRGLGGEEDGGFELCPEDEPVP
jgi:hypothetical protein